MNSIKNKNWLAGFFVAGLLLIMPGCELLEQSPQDRLTREEFFETGADATGSLISVYDALQASEGRMAELGEARADLVEGFPGNEFRLQYINPTSANARWTHFYGVINRANTTIKYVPEIVSKDARFTQQMSDAIVAEAHFLRALAYFYLTRAWKDVPLVLNPSDTDNQDYKIPQTSQNQILDQIEADLNKALELNIPVSFTSNEITRGRATAGAVHALQTDVYLWRGKYTQAIQAADKVINNTTLYNLIEGEDWTDMFFAGNTSESIFEIQHSFAQDELNSAISTYGNNYNINVFGLLEKFNTEGDQIRGQAYQTWGQAQSDLWKFVGNDETGTRRPRNDANWIVYRLADVYLMRAEARNRAGDKQGAIEDLTLIRNRAGLTLSIDASATENEIEDAILHERGLELAFEGKRWFDLLRISNQRLEAHRRPDVLRTLIVNSYPEAIRSEMEGRIRDERGWYMPISQTELQANRALIQNPYYL